MAATQEKMKTSIAVLVNKINTNSVYTNKMKKTNIKSTR